MIPQPIAGQAVGWAAHDGPLSRSPPGPAGWRCQPLRRGREEDPRRGCVVGAARAGGGLLASSRPRPRSQIRAPGSVQQRLGRWLASRNLLSERRGGSGARARQRGVAREPRAAPLRPPPPPPAPTMCSCRALLTRPLPRTSRSGHRGRCRQRDQAARRARGQGAALGQRRRACSRAPTTAQLESTAACCRPVRSDQHSKQRGTRVLLTPYCIIATTRFRRTWLS